MYVCDNLALLVELLVFQFLQQLHLRLHAEDSVLEAGHASHPDPVLPQQVPHYVDSQLVNLFPLIAMWPRPELDRLGPALADLRQDLRQGLRAVHAGSDDVAEPETLLRLGRGDSRQRAASGQGRS